MTIKSDKLTIKSYKMTIKWYYIMNAYYNDFLSINPEFYTSSSKMNYNYIIY